MTKPWTMEFPCPRVVTLYTNRNVDAFGADGHQIPEIQECLTCYNHDPMMVKLVAEHATTFTISKWREWAHEISREEFLYLMGCGYMIVLERETTKLDSH